ncbi:MAG: EamA family transporter [Saprospiraceae bacterium]|nr:EamA family transporter [Saprospiraceae bacterium]
MKRIFHLNSEVQNAYILLHISVFLWGFTAILGQVITISAIPLVWWRILLTLITIFLIFDMRDELRGISFTLYKKLIYNGILISIHWLLFYAAIKASNASITLVCLSTTSFFTSIIEPMLNRSKIKWYQFFIGIIIVPGMLLVFNSVQERMYWGLFLGLGAAFVAAVFSSLNKKIVDQVSAQCLSFVELGAGFLFLSVMVIVTYFADVYTLDDLLPNKADFIYLIILALVCTTLPFIFSIKALRHLSAFASNLTINLEPIYGVILAWLILKENKELNTQFYIGGAIILLAVVFYPSIRNFFEKEEAVVDL